MVVYTGTVRIHCVNGRARMKTGLEFIYLLDNETTHEMHDVDISIRIVEPCVVSAIMYQKMKLVLILPTVPSNHSTSELFANHSHAK